MSETQRSPELWRQLKATVDVLLQVSNGQSGSAAMDAVPPHLRGAVQALAFHAWRNQGRSTAIRSLLAKKPPAPHADALLCLALGLLSNDADASYNAFTLVNQTVEAAKQCPRTRPQANFINACLRRYLREAPQLLAEADRRLEARWNHPLWWIKKVQQDHPDRWEAVLTAANRHPPMTLRVNLRKVTSAQYALSLQTAGIEVSNAYGACIELAKPVAVTQLPGFQEGWVSVQDGAAQVAATLLLEAATPQERPRILDACAAPGGKTAHLLELVEADVLALEIDPTRAQRIEQTLNRLGLTATVLCADAAEPPTWWDGRPFDYILLDAPCTASGIVRRHPDIRWLRRPTDVAQLAAEQRRILKGLWPLVKEGGRLLYCTCSIFRVEGDEQVKAFLDNNKDARLLQSPGHLIPAAVPTPSVMADNQIGDHDGFFYALFEKTRV